jgi:hypothetical protein
MNLMKHVKVSGSLVLTVLVMLAATSRANAQFVVVDTFEKESLGPIDGQNGWTSKAGVEDKAHCYEPENANGKLGCDGNAVRVQVVVDPTDPNNHVLQYGGKAETVHTYKSIKIPNSNTASTLFFRVRRTGEVNMNWGLSAAASPSQWPDYEVQLNMQTVDTNKIRIRDGNKALESVLFPANTWYKTWFVINNATDTYEVFMQGGAMEKPTQISAGGKTVFGFRNGHADKDLVNIFLRTTPPHTTDFQFDDIYLDTSGRNLNDPTAGSTARR